MTVYKVYCDEDYNFLIHTYDFWSYVLSVKLYKGRLFFNRQKAEKWADECNALVSEVKAKQRRQAEAVRNVLNYEPEV